MDKRRIIEPARRVRTESRQHGTVTETEREAGEEPAEQASRQRPKAGLGKLVYDLQHRRRRFRQLMGAVLVLVVTFFGEPKPVLLDLGTAVACLGVGVRLAGSGFVEKNEGLATRGPYAFVRHPLYVGNLLICAGFCLASGVWWSVPYAILTLLLFYPDAIRYEDRKLRRLFPGEWDRWAASTRALIPRLTPYRAEGPVEPPGDAEPSRGASWSLQLSMMRNGEPIHIVVMGACLVYLYSIV